MSIFLATRNLLFKSCGGNFFSRNLRLKQSRLLLGSKHLVKNFELFAIELIYLNLHGWILEHLFDHLLVSHYLVRFLCQK